MSDSASLVFHVVVAGLLCVLFELLLSQLAGVALWPETSACLYVTAGLVGGWRANRKGGAT